jgi:tetratricopeptide (TPR) repeat protein
LDLRYERTDLPWAAFDVTFPVGQDVLILVEYTTQAYGYEPYMALRYVLETGAGWKGTIGTADIVVRLPYDASPENVLLPQVNVSSEAAPSVEFSAQEVRWHFEDLEPTSENNIEVSLAIPSYWQRVVDELANVEANPQDGEAWGRLGKAYKEVVRLKKGQFRHDPEGVEMFARSVAAYERALAILPDEGLWQYELAELLYTHSSRNIKNLDRQEFQRALYHLNRALALAPTEPVIRALADDISANYPADVGHTEAGYEFYSLTATPIPFVTPPASRMPVIYPTLHPPLPTRTPTMIPQSAPSPGSPSPFGGIPICGAALLPVAGLFVARRKFAG